MANKYLIHGATYCGDGTTSAEAASAGAAGAWNNINVFEGTAPAYGSLAAGDTVYIRSKTGAGADAAITRTLGASVTLGSSSATAGAWITWVIDGGTKWSGINGVVTYECPSTYTTSFRAYNYYRAELEDKFLIKETNTSADYKKICTFPSSCRTDNLFVDCSVNTHATGNWMDFAENENIHKNLHLKWAKHYAALISLKQWSNATFINLTVELTVSDTQSGVFNLGDYGSSVTVIGGRVFGTGATTNNVLVYLSSAGRNGTARFIGFQVPKTMTLLANTSASGPWGIEAIGMDAEEGGVIWKSWGRADSRSDGYYPYLNAFLPDSVSTPWSWRVYPQNAGLGNQFSIPVGKEYTATAATKTITGYVLLADSITTANKATLWLEVTYIDNSTGNPVNVSTRDFAAGALTTSTADWSDTTIAGGSDAGINLVRRELSVTTTTSIKQDTMVTVALCGTFKSASALDIFFFCPDVSLT